MIFITIDEKITITLDTSVIADEIDVSGVDTIKVTNLTSSTTYDWSNNASYYNGVDQVQLEEKAINFETIAGINYIYDTVVITSTDNSITVELGIVNESNEPVDMKFYDESFEDDNRTELTELTMIDEESSSEPQPDIPSGWVTYGTTDLDYNTKYDLYIQIGDSRDEQLDLITTLDAYLWTRPLSITLLVINNWSDNFGNTIWFTILKFKRESIIIKEREL